MIFKVVDCIDRNRKLTLSENDRQWHEMANSFRMGNVTVRAEESLVRKYDFIEGSVAMVTRSETSGEMVLVPKPSSYQMCLISDNFRDKFKKKPSLDPVLQHLLNTDLMVLHLVEDSTTEVFSDHFS